MAELQADNITDSAGTGSPKFSNGQKGNLGVAPTAGNIGELLFAASAGGPVSGSGQFTDAASVSLTPGVWDVSGAIQLDPQGTNPGWGAAISLTSGANDDAKYFARTQIGGVSLNGLSNIVPPMRRVVVTVTTPVYIQAWSNFSGTPTNFTNLCFIQALRVA